MNNNKRYEQLAHDIANDGFSQHGQAAATLVNEFYAELRLLERVTASLVDVVNDADLPDIVRARAFGKLRFNETDRLSAQLVHIAWNKSTLVAV